MQSIDQLDKFVRQTLHSGNAIVGSCAMGLDSRKGAVVDAALRVFGIAHLRIADASIFPTMPGGQTGAGTMMLAERAAKLLMS